MSATQSGVENDDDLRREFLQGGTKGKEKRIRPRCRLEPRQILLIMMVIGAALGVTLGTGLRAAGWGPHTTPAANFTFLNFPGEIFLRMLNSLILPLMLSTLVNSLTSLHAGTANVLGTTTALFYVATTLIAAAEGLLLVQLIQPGRRTTGGEQEDFELDNCATSPVHSILDLIRNIFPPNMVGAAVETTRTCLTFNETVKNVSSAALSLNISVVLHEGEATKVSVTEVPGMNAMGIVVIAIAFGVVISRMGEAGQPLADIFVSLEELTMRLIGIVMWFAPVGICFLIATQIVHMKNPVGQLSGLALYVGTVLIGLILHGFVVLPIIYFLLIRRNPLTYAKGTIRAFLTALGTDSSSATIPASVECVTQLGVDPTVAKFVMPVGANLNMSGSALYEAVAALFVAQAVGVELSVGRMIVVSLTATLVSVAGANIPSAGPVTILMALNAADLPPEYASLVIPADWFLDRIRTGFTVFGDCICAAIVMKFCKKRMEEEKELQLIDRQRRFSAGSHQSYLGAIQPH